MFFYSRFLSLAIGSVLPLLRSFDPKIGSSVTPAQGRGPERFARENSTFWIPAYAGMTVIIAHPLGECLDTQKSAVLSILKEISLFVDKAWLSLVGLIMPKRARNHHIRL